MVFEEIIRHSPRRRALPCLAEGFSPTASAVERNKFSIFIISVYTPPDAGVSHDTADLDEVNVSEKYYNS
jgi:hypothetical protein